MNYRERGSKTVMRVSNDVSDHLIYDVINQSEYTCAHVEMFLRFTFSWFLESQKTETVLTAFCVILYAVFNLFPVTSLIFLIGFMMIQLKITKQREKEALKVLSEVFHSNSLSWLLLFWLLCGHSRSALQLNPWHLRSVWVLDSDVSARSWRGAISFFPWLVSRESVRVSVLTLIAFCLPVVLEHTRNSSAPLRIVKFSPCGGRWPGPLCFFLFHCFMVQMQLFCKEAIDAIHDFHTHRYLSCLFFLSVSKILPSL